VSRLSDADLYQRGGQTLLASWEHDARGANGAALQRFAGVAAAVFPNEPERSLYNNALPDRDLAVSERGAAIDAMEAAYEAAGVTGSRPGYTRETTRWVGSATPRLHN
jgi:hypothetical protein